MPTTKSEIRTWLGGLLILEGKIEDYSHMLVVCDTFNYDDYPVYVKRTEDIQEKIDEYLAKDMQNVMEVYNLDMDIEEQLAAMRAWNIEVKQGTEQPKLLLYGDKQVDSLVIRVYVGEKVVCSKNCKGIEDVFDVFKIAKDLEKKHKDLTIKFDGTHILYTLIQQHYNIIKRWKK